jgi:polyhydroxyalkanoate synthesis repressor PhaR
MAEKITLKKYANRRLYDMDQSKYVTLSEVAEQIRSGKQVEVFDAKTKEDVTAFILTQIVLEEAKSKNILLPVALLHIIIQYGDNVLLDFFDNYLQQVIKNYLAYKKTFDSQFEKWLEMGMDLSEVAKRGFDSIHPAGSIFKHFSTPPDAGEKEE